MATLAPGEIPKSTDLPPVNMENQHKTLAKAPTYATPDLQVIRRNGKGTSFDATKIAVAMTKAFLAVEGGSAAASQRVHDTGARTHPSR